MDVLPKKKEKIILKCVSVGVHKVNGDLLAINYMRDTNPKYVESLFFFTKKYGTARFEWTGDIYEIRRNQDLSFTVVKISTDESKGMDSFKKNKEKED